MVLSSIVLRVESAFIWIEANIYDEFEYSISSIKGIDARLFMCSGFL